MERPGIIGDIYNQETTRKYYDVRDAAEAEALTGADGKLYRLIPMNLAGKTAIDVGCGDGRYAAQLCRRGAKKVVGYDLSPLMIERAQARKEEKQLEQLELVQADIDELTPEERSADLIFSRFSLMYGKRIDGIMKNLAAALADDGEILIEASVAEISDQASKRHVKERPVPLRLRIAGESVEIKNYAYTLEDYLDAFHKADLSVEVQERFVANDLSVSEEYVYKNAVKFDYVVFKLKKRHSVA